MRHGCFIPHLKQREHLRNGAHHQACAEEIQSCAIRREIMATVLFDCEGVVYTELRKIAQSLLCNTDVAEQRHKEQEAWKNKQRYCSPARQCNTPHSAHNKRFASNVFNERYRSICHTVQNLHHAIAIFSASWRIVGRGKRFYNDEQVQTAVLEWFHDQKADFCREGIERLVKCSDRCFTDMVTVEKCVCVF